MQAQVADYVYCGSERFYAQHAKIDAAASGDNTLVAVSASTLKIKVLAYTLVTAAAVDVAFRSDTTAISGLMSFDANSGVSAYCGSIGCTTTAAGEDLNLNLSGAVQVSGTLTYVECP